MLLFILVIRFRRLLISYWPERVPSPSPPRWVCVYLEAVAANEELTAVDARARWGSSSEDEEVDFEEGKDTAVTSITAKCWVVGGLDGSGWASGRELSMTVAVALTLVP